MTRWLRFSVSLCETVASVLSVYDDVHPGGQMRRAILVSIGILGVVASVRGAGSPSGASAPTFAKDVAPIIFNRCATCHRPGEVAPMTLLSYDDVRPWAKAIREKVRAREMPPWGADPEHSLKMR